MKTPITSKRGYYFNATTFAVAVSISLSSFVAEAADIFWTDGTGSYTNAPNWTGGVVPGTGDHGIVSNGVVQINVGNPDWTLDDLSAGGTADSSGAIQQNGQTLNMNSWLHIADGLNAIGVFRSSV